MYRNIEKVMGMFSEELRILDRNTVQYMIDEMKAEIDSQKAAIEHRDARLREVSEELHREALEKQRMEQRIAEPEKLLADKAAGR